MIDKQEIAAQLQLLQDDICRNLEHLDGNGCFREDAWLRPGGGGGRSRIIAQGQLIEKGGVNFSAVHGPTSPAMLQALHLEAGVAAEFFATGVSIVLHPHNPWVPIIHLNVRYFELNDSTWWFGGGIDLTPHYIFPQQAATFHRALQTVCDDFLPDAYRQYKAIADDYFFIRHRQETRGIGGIFFDRLNTGSLPKSKAEIWSFVWALGNAFVPIYRDATSELRQRSYTDREKAWQFLRRGRYAEFNLVYDRGTRFGLETDGRTESILMSLPPQANWTYDFQPEPDSPEAATQALLRKGIDWIGGKQLPTRSEGQ